MGGHRAENMFRLVGGGMELKDKKCEDIKLKMFRLVGGSLAPPDAHISAQHIADQH